MTNGLFKYFSTDQDKLERFTKGQVYLTPPKYLNDPWEFRLRIEPATEEYLREHAPFLSPEGMAEFRKRTGSGDWLEEGAEDQRELFSKIIGLVCLTENPLDMLMWAHYGESHKGFVAEFGPSDDEARHPAWESGMAADSSAGNDEPTLHGKLLRRGRVRDTLRPCKA